LSAIGAPIYVWQLGNKTLLYLRVRDLEFVNRLLDCGLGVGSVDGFLSQQA
jgi:hypothetical protein